MSRHICFMAGCHDRPTYVWVDRNGSVRYLCAEHSFDVKQLPPTVPPAVIAAARESVVRESAARESANHAVAPRRRWAVRRRTA